ncbi:DUF2254 domain-containing protein [Pontibacter mangrovi]|uniref:DUF2254 domain-containing protein n=1 Tax=Pontibacter mangrovi TaxID=2589816 RepID=A0A501WFY5_9BACT|nr:DUF2254 domain-containing protein [Pontibacter mangrovi]TPE45897.1 DUF2254 domain-containing protein [Pontibacter mangrovi]
MSKILSKLKFLYQYIISSIGFLPTLISAGFFVLAFVVLYLETTGLSQFLRDQMPFMIINNGDTARLILSTIATGIISLMVFSFTMVMLVLNQASSNFSPRVIPGLITYKANQSVTGLYLGTVIYTLVIMVNIRSDFYSVALPGFAIFLSMCFAIASLGFFVYFIHSISQSIQIENILQDIYRVTEKQLEYEVDRQKNTPTPNIFEHREGWVPLMSPRTGYLQSLDEDAVVSLMADKDLVLDFNYPLGAFLVEGVPFAYINKEVPEMEEFRSRLFSYVSFYLEERPSINYIFGFKHITESAVKALSPGINDPGTAIKAIDYLTALFALRMQLSDEKLLLDADGAARIRFRHDTFKELYSMCLSPIRLYGKQDSTIMLKLLSLLQSLLYKVQPYPHLKPVLYDEAIFLLQTADENIPNPGDRQRINQVLLHINKMKAFSKPLPPLAVA